MKNYLEKLRTFAVWQAIRLVIRNYFAHRVGENAAALAYYLLFALFPLMIFVSNLLGLFDLDILTITQTLQKILPDDIVRIVETYLDYISHTSSHTLLWFSLVFSIWFPMRAVQGLMNDVRRAYSLGKPGRPVVYIVSQLAYTVVFLVVIMLTLLLSTLSEQVLSYLISMLPEHSFRISDYLLELWQYIRFLPMALLMIAAIGTLYAASLDRKPQVKEVAPGIAAALISWMVVSVGFSFYVENFANYSVIYGTLGAMMVLLIWLYLTAMILILGAELNAALLTSKQKEKP